MKNSKLSYLLKSFKGYEFLLFKKFISSPYYNNKAEIIKLYEFILSNYTKDNDDLDIGDKKDAFNFIYPNKEFNAEKMRRLSSELTLLIQQFFVSQETRYDEVIEKQLLIDAFNKRNLTKYFISESERLIQKIKTERPKDIKSQFNLYNLSQNLHFYQNNPRSKKDIGNIIEAQEKLDAFYMVSKLKLACELIVRENTFNNNIDIPLFHEIVKLSHVSKYRDNPLFELYALALKSLESQEDLNSFNQFKKSYFSNLSALSEKEKLSLFLIILNITGFMINQGKYQNYSEQLDLYKQAIKEKIILINNRITPESFTNIVILAAQIKDFKWAENFIKSHSKYLDPKNKERSIAFSHGYIAYRKGDFEEAIQKLWNCKFDQLPFDVRTKSIIARALFEQFINHPDKYDFCWGQLLTIERYFRRKTDLSEKKSEAYLNFIKNTKKLIILKRKGKFTKSEIVKLRAKINGQSNLVGKPWLLEKLT